MTKSTKISDIKRSWHLIDLKDIALGRISTKIANLLMGKNKPYFVRNLDCGDYVVAINANHFSTSGKKAEKKIYYRYSGFPGGLKSETLSSLKQRNPKDVIYHAVKGMLPQNKLRDKMINRLYVFDEEEHTYKDKFEKNK